MHIDIYTNYIKQYWIYIYILYIYTKLIWSRCTFSLIAACKFHIIYNYIYPYSIFHCTCQPKSWFQRLIIPKLLLAFTSAPWWISRSMLRLLFITSKRKSFLQKKNRWNIDQELLGLAFQTPGKITSKSSKWWFIQLEKKVTLNKQIKYRIFQHYDTSMVTEEQCSNAAPSSSFWRLSPPVGFCGSCRWGWRPAESNQTPGLGHPGIFLFRSSVGWDPKKKEEIEILVVDLTMTMIT